MGDCKVYSVESLIDELRMSACKEYESNRVTDTEYALCGFNSHLDSIEWVEEVLLGVNNNGRE